jgi:uncharacterized protein Usg
VPSALVTLQGRILVDSPLAPRKIVPSMPLTVTISFSLTVICIVLQTRVSQKKVLKKEVKELEKEVKDWEKKIDFQAHSIMKEKQKWLK